MEMSMHLRDELFHLKDREVFIALPAPAASYTPGLKLVFVGDDYIAVKRGGDGQMFYIPIVQIISISEA